MDSVDDDVGYELQGQARASSNVDVVSSAVNRFEATHEEFVLKLDTHVP